MQPGHHRRYRVHRSTAGWTIRAKPRNWSDTYVLVNYISSSRLLLGWANGTGHARTRTIAYPSRGGFYSDEECEAPQPPTPTEPLGLGILKRKYNRRWWMLFVSSLLNVANSAVWIACQPFKTLVQEYERPTCDRSVDQHSLFAVRARLDFGFFILKRGVAISTGVGGALLTICCWLRSHHRISACFGWKY